MDKYRILQVIGEGTYGKVFKAQEKETGRVVAIKKFKQREDEDPHVRKTMMREIRILREYRHTNIVNLRTVFRENGKLYLIFDYVQKTLLEELQATPDGLPFERIKSITYQILKANYFLHEGNIIHRDIKPENLLISKAGIVKLCDFGFARPLNSSATYQYTDYVSTRWYRAPELLVGDAAYSGTVDVWAIGCIFAEIFNGMPLFPGDSDLHTLQLILETVTADDMEHNNQIQELSKKQRVAFRMNPLFEGTKVPLASESIKSPETVQEVSLKALLKGINDIQLDFVRRCLVIDGGQRANMQELLDHPVFDEEFKKNFDAELQRMTEDDEKEMQQVALSVLTTKDGRQELSPEELVTEDEKGDDDDDDDDEFDDDDSSSAVGSPGETSSVDTPGSSSGVQLNRMGAGGAHHHNHQQALYGGELGNSRDANEMQSVKTAVPPIGDGLIPNGSDRASIEKLIQQNSMVSVSINNQTAGDHDGIRNDLDSADGTQNKTRVLLSSVSKTHENATPDSAEYYTKNNLTGTQDSLQTQKLIQSTGAEEQKNAAKTSTSNNTLKEAKQLRNDSQEQLQITKGVNGTASLQNNKQEQNPRTEPAKKETEEDRLEGDSKNNFTPKPKVPVTLEHQNIKVRVSAANAPAADYFPDASKAPGGQPETSSLLNSHHSTPSKAQKRTSLNHYMIESSITEEIREENYSDKTSSGNASQQNTPNNQRNGANKTKASKDKEDHVIVREGVTSMFQHPASMVVTEEGTEPSPEQQAETDDLHQQHRKSQLKQEQPPLHDKINNKANQNKIVENSVPKDEQNISKMPKGSGDGTKSPEKMNSLANTTTTKEGTEIGSAGALQQNQSIFPAMAMSRAQTLDQAGGSDVAATKADSNPIALKLMHTENQKQTGSQSLSTSANQQQPRLQQITSGSGNTANPQISKVNITFGPTSHHAQPSANTASQQTSQQQTSANKQPQTSLINLQMMNNSNASAVSRQSSNTNGGNLGMLNSNSTQEQQSYQSTAGRSEVLYSQAQRPGEMKGAMIDSRQQYANINVTQPQQNASGRAATNNSSSNGNANKINNASNAPSQHSQSQQRSSISLKQGGVVVSGAINSNNGMHQTAREFTPHKKPSLVAASPATIQQHSFGIEGSGIRHTGMDSTAAKTSQSRPGMLSNSLAIGQQEMSVTHFSGKPIYQVQQYPKTVVKGPGPKQTTVLKQTSSLEKLDNRNISPHKLPNLKPINNSSMSQYGAGGNQNQHSNTASKQVVNSDENRIGEGLTNLAAHQQNSSNQRQGPNSMQNHFSSHQTQQRYPANSHSMNTGATGNKLTSGSTQSLTTKMNFTSQNYHRASNSQTNEAPNLHHLTPNVANAPLQSSNHQRGQPQASNTQGNSNSIAANSAKKSQLIHPLKLVAFPKLMATDEQNQHQNQINVTTSSPKTNGLSSKKTSLVSNHATAAIIHHYHNNNSLTKASPTQHNMMNSGAKTTGSNIQKKLPNGGGGSIGNQGHIVSSSTNSNNQNPANVHNALMMSSKTQATKMPKRYSDMGMMSTQLHHAAGGAAIQQQNNSLAAANQSKFVGSHLPQGAEQVALTGNTFHPTLTNEYMLSQDSLVLNEVNSRPSRQSSKNLDHQPSMSNGKNLHHQQQQNSVESHRPRNQAPSHISSNNQKSRTGGGGTQHGGGPNSHNIPANQSFHSTMKSKNNKFIHQNSSTSHHPTKGTSVNQSGILASSSTKAPPATSDKKIHQHFLEEFSEATSQRASLVRPKNATDGLNGAHQKTPMTSLFQKSKFFQSQSSNAENTNPNSLNVHSGSGYHQHQASNHYGQSSYQGGGQSTSPNRTIGTNKKQQEVTMLSNFTDKDSFPRRNITNKLRNASNLQHKKTNKFNQLDGQQHASTATSPSPLSLHQREAAKNAGGIVLPNLGSTTTGNLSTQQQAIGQATSHSNGSNVFMNVQSQHQQQHIMQVSLTQLHATANDPRSNNLSTSPNIVRNKEKASNLGTQKLSAVANVVQLNASEFNLRLTNNSQLSSSGGAVKGQVMPYQQIVRKPPSVIQPGRAQQYQMYLTPSQNYTSGANNSVANRASQNAKTGSTGTNQKPAGANKQANQQVLKNSGNGSSPTSLNKKISNENSFNVQKNKNQATGGGNPHRSPVINGGTVSYKVKTETDWHRGSQQQLFEVSNMGQSNQLYRVSNQLLEKSISPQRIQQAMKRGSNVQMMSSQGGIAIVGGPPAAQSVSNNYTENKINFSNQQQKRRQTGATVESGQAAASVAVSSGIINDSSQDSLPVQSPNLLRKKFISKQQNQIK